jgi:hypothetical protein
LSGLLSRCQGLFLGVQRLAAAFAIATLPAPENRITASLLAICPAVN